MDKCFIELAESLVTFVKKDVKPMNKTQNHPASHSKFRMVRYLLPLVIIGLAAYKFLPQITTLEKSISVIRSMSVWLIILAFVAQVCSYVGSGYLLKEIVSLGQSRLSIFRGALIAMVAASIGLVAGGWISAAAVTYRLVEKSDNSPEEATLAGVLPMLYNTALLVIISTLGLGYLLIAHQLSSALMFAYSLILFIFWLGFLLIIFGIKHQEIVESLILWIINHFMHLFGRVYDTTPVSTMIDSIFTGLKLLLNGRWKKPAIGSGINIAFDMLTLYLLFIAAGHAANPVVLMAGYSVAFLLEKGVFFIPGGIGVIESGMVAIYTSLGIPGAINVVVILSYRLISFWLPSLLGFAVAVYLQRTSANIQRQKLL